MTVQADLVDVLAAAIEQTSPEARARLRAALEVEPVSPIGDTTVSAYTPATLARELGRTPRAIRAAIQRGELDAVKRGRGWVISADAVERWTQVPSRRDVTPRRRPRAPGRGPMARALRT